MGDDGDDVCRLVGAACRAGVNGLLAPPAAVADSVAGVQRSYLIHSINYGSIRNVAFLPSLPPRDKRGWAGWADLAGDRGAGGRGMNEVNISCM